MKMYIVKAREGIAPLGYFLSEEAARLSIEWYYGAAGNSMYTVEAITVDTGLGADWEKRTWDLAVKLFNLYKDMDTDSAILTAKAFVKRYLEMTDEAKEEEE